MEREPISKIARGIFEREKNVGQKQRLALQFNPFNYSLIAPEHPTVTIARDKEQKNIVNFIVDVYHTRQSAAMAVLGDYGLGKTHLLRYIRDDIIIANKILSNSRIIAVLYAETAGSNFSDLFAKFIEDAINEDPDIEKPNLIDDCINSIMFDYVMKLTKDEFLRKMPGLSSYLYQEKQNNIPQHKSIWALFQELRISRPMDLVKIVSSSINKIIKDESYSKAFAYLYLYDKKFLGKLALKFIKGEKLSKIELKKIGISTQITTEPIQLIKMLVTLLKKKYHTIVFFIDEFEDWQTTVGSKSKRVDNLSEFRRIIDSFYEDIAWIVFCVPGQWTSAMKEYNALQRRFFEPLLIRSFNLEELKRFIKETLSNEKKGYWSKDDIHYRTLFPFTEDAVKEIHEYVSKYKNGRIGFYSRLCHKLFNKYLMERKEITVNDVKQMINSPDLSELQ
ncbi:MAG: P-loop NTPase fold protein [Candidatus Heimdallarchaeaceae archaeon]